MAFTKYSHFFHPKFRTRSSYVQLLLHLLTGLSALHAQIIFADGAHILRDLGSSNGTTVNGQPIIEARLKDNDTVAFGSVVSRFQERDQQSRLPGEDPIRKPKKWSKLKIVLLTVLGMIVLFVLVIGILLFFVVTKAEKEATKQVDKIKAEIEAKGPEFVQQMQMEHRFRGLEFRRVLQRNVGVHVK